MTRSGEVKRAGEVLSKILESLHLRQGLAGWRAVSSWGEIVGPEHGKHTKAVRFASGRLFIEVDSSARMAQLGMEKPELLRKIGAVVGAGVVRDLMFVMAGRSSKEERT